MRAFEPTEPGRPTTHLAGLPISLPRAAAVSLALLAAVLAPACSAPPASSVPLPLTPEWWVPALPMSHAPLSALLGAAPAAAARWGPAHQAAVESYLATLARGGPQTDPELFPAPAYVLAYLVDAHVGWTLALGHAPALAGRDVAGLQRVPFTLGGAPMTLERLVGEIWLRSPLEPRIRLLLNPGWRGGPELPGCAVEGHSLDWQIAEQAARCGRTPGFWAFDPPSRQVRLSAFSSLLWGLPDAPQARARRLLDLVPPQPELRTAILSSCGSALQHCSVVLVPFDQSRRWTPSPDARSVARSGA